MVARGLLLLVLWTAFPDTGLAVAHGTGRGVPRDAVRSTRWWKRAAEAGSRTAMAILAAHYELGLGTEPNAEQAAYWYRRTRMAPSSPANTGLVLVAGVQ